MLLAELSSETVTIVGTMIVTVLTLLINGWLADQKRQNERIQDRADRIADKEQERLDRSALAALTERKANEVAAVAVREADAIRAAAIDREQRIIAKVDEAAGKADAAYTAGNGNQEKFAKVQAVLDVHSEALKSPTKVEIANDASHPVPTKPV